MARGMGRALTNGAGFARRMAHYLTGNFSQASDDERREMTKDIVSISAKAGAALAVQPVPVADFFVITPCQIAMVLGIANVYGHRPGLSVLREVACTIGGGALGRQVCLALIKLGFPGLGGVGSAGFVFAWTLGMGRAAELYFSSEMTARPVELASAGADGILEARDLAAGDQ